MKKSLLSVLCVLAVVAVCSKLIGQTNYLSGLKITSSLTTHALPLGSYQWNPQHGIYDNVCDIVTVGNVRYYVAGPAGFDVHRSIEVLKQTDGSLLVPYIPISTSGWGGAVEGVRIGVAVDKPSAVIHQPLFAQITIQNNGSKPYQMHYGCGPNMELALPVIVDSKGRGVKQNFVVGQGMCAGVWSYDVPAHSTYNFIFNVNDLYDIGKPGVYIVERTMATSCLDCLSASDTSDLTYGKKDNSGVQFEITAR